MVIYVFTSNDSVWFVFVLRSLILYNLARQYVSHCSQVLLEAARKRREFRVVVVDARPETEGRKMLQVGGA